MAERFHTRTQPRLTLSIFFASGGILCAFLAAALVVLTIISVREYNKAARLEADGVNTVANIVDMKVEHRRRSNSNGTTTHYYLTLAYVVDATTYRWKTSVASSEYGQSLIGQ